MKPNPNTLNQHEDTDDPNLSYPQSVANLVVRWNSFNHDQSMGGCRGKSTFPSNTADIDVSGTTLCLLLGLVVK